MGKAGSKLCETERFKPHQYDGDGMQTTASHKRPRSPTPELNPEDDGQPECKRSKIQQSDNPIEFARRDVERRFQAFRSEPHKSTVAQPTVVAVSAILRDSTSRPQRPSTLSSSTTFGHHEVASLSSNGNFGTPTHDLLIASRSESEQASAAGSHHLCRQIPDSRPSSPKLLENSTNEADGLGWSLRHTNTDAVRLANTLLLTNNFPNYAAAFRAAGKNNISPVVVTNKQHDGNTRGIRLANMILGESELEYEHLGDLLGYGTMRPRRGGGHSTPLQLPDVAKVKSAFDGGRLSSRSEDQTKIRRGKQRWVGGVWARGGWQNLNGRRVTTTSMNRSINKTAGWETEWEPLRAGRERHSLG